MPFAVWSNFEIGDLNFWRGEAYGKFFDFLDSKGGFYYEVRMIFSSHPLPYLPFFHGSDGEMRQCTQSAPLCSPKRNRSISLKILGIGTSRSSIVRKGRVMRRGSAGALRARILVSPSCGLD